MLHDMICTHPPQSIHAIMHECYITNLRLEGYMGDIYIGIYNIKHGYLYMYYVKGLW